MLDFFSGLNRQGPGGDDETLRALNFLGHLPAQAKIADIGCGTGQQTEVLAVALEAAITAVDVFPELLATLDSRMQRMGIENVSSQEASMHNLPFQPEELDVIWSEGAIYNIGFEKGLTSWKPFLKPGGAIAVTDCCWLKARASMEQRPAFIRQAFPEMDTVSNKLRIMEDAGYLPLAHFVLPESCWMDNYYKPMQRRIPEFLAAHNNSEPAQQLVAALKEEIACYEQHKASYGYVFFIGIKL